MMWDIEPQTRKYGPFDFILDAAFAWVIVSFTGNTIKRFRDGGDDKKDDNDKGPKPPGGGGGLFSQKSLFDKDKSPVPVPVKKEKLGVDSDIFR